MLIHCHGEPVACKFTEASGRAGEYKEWPGSHAEKHRNSSGLVVLISSWKSDVRKSIAARTRYTTAPFPRLIRGFPG